jgi:hypothetical protein
MWLTRHKRARNAFLSRTSNSEHIAAMDNNDYIIPPLSSLPRSPGASRRSSSARSPRLMAQQIDNDIPRRMPTQSTQPLDEHALNELEWEEERMINQLTQKLEKVALLAFQSPRIRLRLARRQLRADKAKLENDLEAESESMVLKLQKQLQALSREQQDSSDAAAISPPLSLSHLATPHHPEIDPSVLLQENTTLRNKLHQTEAAYIKLTRLNDVYRSELIELRSRLGIDVSDLVGHSSATSTGMPMRPDKGSSRDRTVSFGSSSYLSTLSSSQLTSGTDSESSSLQTTHTSDTTPSTSYRSPPVPNSTPSTSYRSSGSLTTTPTYARAPPNSLASSIPLGLNQSPAGSPTSIGRPDKVHPCDIPDRPNVRVGETGRLMARGRPRRHSSQEQEEREEQTMEMSPVQEHSN